VSFICSVGPGVPSSISPVSIPAASSLLAQGSEIVGVEVEKDALPGRVNWVAVGRHHQLRLAAFERRPDGSSPVLVDARECEAEVVVEGDRACHVVDVDERGQRLIRCAGAAGTDAGGPGPSRMGCELICLIVTHRVAACGVTRRDDWPGLSGGLRLLRALDRRRNDLASSVSGYERRSGHRSLQRGARGAGGAWLPGARNAQPERGRWIVDDWIAGWSGDESFNGPALVSHGCGGEVFRRCRGFLRPSGRRDRDGVRRSASLAAQRPRYARDTTAADWLLENASVEEVELRIASDHEMSRRVAERAGFRRVWHRDFARAGTGETFDDVRYARASGETDARSMVGVYRDVMDHVQLVRDTWDALSHGDLAPLQTLFAPDAKWRAVEDGPWNCENRSQIIEVMTENLKGRLSGRIDDAFEIGDRIVVAFRPDRGPDEWPLDNGIRYVVVSLDGDLITR